MNRMTSLDKLFRKKHCQENSTKNSIRQYQCHAITFPFVAMNPNLTKKDDCNIRNSTDIPSHGAIPKWLEEITVYEKSLM